jgi:hypothetical protein
MTVFSSTVRILTVENEERTTAKGNKFPHFAARSILLGDDGETVITVGALRTRDVALQAKCVPGTYRATFALQVPDWGDNKGDICAVLTDLTPLPANAVRRPVQGPAAST